MFSVGAPQGLARGASSVLGFKSVRVHLGPVNHGRFRFIKLFLFCLYVCVAFTDLHSVRRRGRLSWSVRHFLLLQRSSLVAGHLQRERERDRERQKERERERERERDRQIDSQIERERDRQIETDR